MPRSRFKTQWNALKRLLGRYRPGIFLRIYGGLLLVCLLVGTFAYLLIQNINMQRMQLYYEDMAKGPFRLISASIDREIQQGHNPVAWIKDANLLLGFPVQVIRRSDVEFSRGENRRLNNQDPVIRYKENLAIAEVYTPLSNANYLVYAQIDRLGEQQLKAMGVILMDDLAHHKDNLQGRISQLQNWFGYNLSLYNQSQLKLDVDQQMRLQRKEIVTVFRDSGRSDTATLEVYCPLGNGMVLQVGPIYMFNRMPLQLFVFTTAISMLLISIGVYTLIFPLERKLRQVRLGMRQVSNGDLSTRLPVKGQDEVSQLADMFNQMTEHIQRLIEAQRELTRAVSHELRTPVARIRFAVEMLADTDDAQTRLKQQEQIDDDIASLNGLIDEILTYAKLEQGRPSLQLEEIDLTALVDQIVKETKALGKPLEIHNCVPKNHIFAVAERRYLHRVLQNFAGNATRYANKVVCISAGVENGWAYVSVEDDGAGVPEKDRKKIFDPFSRLDDSRTRASGGYGLGLSIVSRIAFWFNGVASVDKSEHLGGARFMMRWPVNCTKCNKPMPALKDIKHEHND